MRAAFGVISRLPKAEECDLRESLTEAKKALTIFYGMMGLHPWVVKIDQD